MNAGYGLTVRWSLTQAPDDVADQLREYVVGTSRCNPGRAVNALMMEAIFSCAAGSSAALPGSNSRPRLP